MLWYSNGVIHQQDNTVTSQLRPLWWPWWPLEEVDLFPKSVFKCPPHHWDAFIDLLIYVFIFWLYSYSNKQLTYHQVKEKTRHALMQITKYWKIQKQICKSPKLTQPLMISDCILTFLLLPACFLQCVCLPSEKWLYFQSSWVLSWFLFCCFLAHLRVSFVCSLYLTSSENFLLPSLSNYVQFQLLSPSRAITMEIFKMWLEQDSRHRKQ